MVCANIPWPPAIPLHRPLALVGDGEFGVPGGVGEHAGAGDLGVDQIGLAVFGGGEGAAEGGLEFGGRGDFFAFDAEAFGETRHVDFGIADVVMHEVAGLATAETFAMPYLEMGVSTYSSAIFNFMPEWALNFYRSVRARDHATGGVVTGRCAAR